jgi:sugar/nucleoside kinase (ribokinase family)
MYEVTCLGIIVADVIAKTVDALPQKGKLDLIDQLELHLGGCASNAAVDLEKIGIKTAVIGRVGDDGFGAFVVNEMKNNNVDVQGIKVSKISRTSASVVSVHSSGERSFLHHIGANADFVTDDINFSIILNSKILFIAGAMLMPAFDGIPAADVLRAVQKAKIITIMDTAWDSTGKWMQLIRPCLQYLDYFIPSLEEAEMISGKSEPEEIADVFLEAGVKTVVIKLGAKGCFIKNNSGEKFLIDSFKGIKAVDTTGAGDSFAAGFITGIIKGWDLKMCGTFANAVGAHCVMKVGATSGIKPLSEIQQFINSYNSEALNVK